MALAVYLDECVNRHLAAVLRERGIRTITALESQTLGLGDESQLLFASRLGLAILSHNQRHFQRLHERFVAEGRVHGGILLLPAGPLPLVTLRALMLVAWVQDRTAITSELVRWHDLQGSLNTGTSTRGILRGTDTASAHDGADATVSNIALPVGDLHKCGRGIASCRVLYQ
jgi:hypothetical protein